MNKNFQKLITAFLCLILLGTASLPAAAVTKGAALYRYNAGTAAKEWKHYARGAWTYDADGISCENNDGRTGDDAWYYTYYGNTFGWTDYVIDCDLEGVSEGGIIFRTANPSDATVDAFDGYYCGTDSDFIFFGKDNGDKWKTIETDGPDASYCYKIGYKAKMHWTIYVQGNTFTLYIDNSKFATAQITDQENSYRSGGIGVRYRVYPGDESGYIKNLTVSKLDTGTSAPVSSSVSPSSNSPVSSSAGPITVNSSGSTVSSTADSSDSAEVSVASSMEDSSSEPTDPVSEVSSGGAVLPTADEGSDDPASGIPAWLWIIIGVLILAVIAVPVILVVMSINDKKRPGGQS